jgi:uncharacterized protein YhaN
MTGEMPIMDDHSDGNALVLELEKRHDELLRELEALDERVEAVLRQWLAERDEPKKAA